MVMMTVIMLLLLFFPIKASREFCRYYVVVRMVIGHERSSVKQTVLTSKEYFQERKN